MPPSRQMGDALTSGLFNVRTRQSFVPLNQINFVDSSPQNIPLPQTGLVGKIRILVSGTTTTAGASSATANECPYAPFSLVRRLILRSSEGADIYNTSGHGNYILNRTLRTSFDYANAYAAGAQAVGQPQTAFSRYYGFNRSLGASQVDNWRFMMSLPVSLGEQNLTGLLMLQNPGVQFQLEIQWGTVADLYRTTTGTVTLTNIVAKPEIEFYHLPASYRDDPDLGFARQIIESTQAITATGDNTFTPPLGNIYLKLIHCLENNNLPINQALVNQLRVQYAQTQVIYSQNPDIQLWRQRKRYGSDIFAGVYVHDWANANDLPEEPTARDLIDTGLITDMGSIFNLDSSLTFTSAQIRTIRDQIVPTT